MLRGQKIIIALLVIAVGLITFSSFAQAQSPVVHAVMFFSPTCPHCKEVIEELLPALDQKYGSQLLIFGVNTYTEQGKALYESYLEVYEVPAEMQGVPALVVGDQYMVGSADIPSRFPAIIDEGLEEGGIDWPPIPGLAETMENASNPENDDPPAISDKMTLKDKFMGDLAGNIL
ncbi:MAG: hypothetical protein DRI65_00365, partial [Chloroflexota bacterium]